MTTDEIKDGMGGKDGKDAVETQDSRTPPIPRALITSALMVCVAMFFGGVYGGSEMAKAEIAQLQLDSITAKGSVVRAVKAVPPHAVIEADSLKLVPTYANRVEPYCINKVVTAAGKKTKYGLEPGQLVTVRDLE